MGAKKKTKKTGKKNPAKKRASARTSPKKNPAKKRASARKSPKRNPAKKRASARKSPKRNAARRAPRRNARRRMRRNPGFGNIGQAAIGLGAGFVAALASSWINDAPLGNQRPMLQNGTLVAEGLATVYFVEDVPVMVGMLVGIFLVPIAKFVYGAAPGLANPRAWGAPPVVVVTASPAPPTMAVPAGPPATISGLHRANIRVLRGLSHAYGSGIGALHNGVRGLHNGSMRALHDGSMRALHDGSMRALHDGAMHGAVAMGRLPNHRSDARHSRAR